MKLIFKQRFFSWLDSYDVYYEGGEVAYTVKGQLSWGHRLKVFDSQGREIAEVVEKVLTLLPQFDLYLGGCYAGKIRKEFSLLAPKFSVDYKGWTVRGDFLAWDYQVLDAQGRIVATISKQLLNWADTYVLEIGDSGEALAVLMLVLAIDAEKCSSSD